MNDDQNNDVQPNPLLIAGPAGDRALNTEINKRNFVDGSRRQEGEDFDPQGSQNIAELTDKLEVAEAKAAQIGGTLPETMQNELDSLRRSLQYEKDQRKQAAERRFEAHVQDEMSEIDKTYESEFEAAVTRRMRQHGVDKGTAMQLVFHEERIKGTEATFPRTTRVKQAIEDRNK